MNGKKPTALGARQTIQEVMTTTREIVKNPTFDPDDFEVINIDIEIKNLDPIFHDYKIINLCDIHLGQWMTPEYLDGVIDIVNSNSPDMITLTGDYVSYKFEDVKEDLEKSFKKLKPKDISLAVLGNHDHWLNPQAIKKILRNANIKNISNDVYILRKRRHELYIAGVDSMMVGEDNLEKVLTKIPDKSAAILLAHEPDFADLSSLTKKFSLQISGHSHGGQFVIPGINTTLFRGSYSKKYPVGKYKVGNMVQYTSKGLGTNIFWFRVNCAPEITIFHLKSPEVEKHENQKKGLEDNNNEKNNNILELSLETIESLYKNSETYEKFERGLNKLLNRE
jgi:predicted MPP superfamily phosphohydrolase